MKIIILANKDLASNIALNQLVNRLSKHQIKIFLSDQVGANLNKPKPLVDLKFFEQDLFNQIVFPAEDSKSSQLGFSNRNAQLKTFAGLAKIVGHDIETLNDVNQPSGLAKLAQIDADVILSIRFGKILKAAAIATAKKGVLNLHSGLLPEYQGVMATFWAMLNQESHYGSTLHFIDSAAIDAGPIVDRYVAPLDYNKSYLENVVQLYTSGCSGMIDAVNRLASNEPLEAKQQSGQAFYFSFPEHQDLSKFAHMGFNLFDIQHVMQLVKAYQSDE